MAKVKRKRVMSCKNHGQQGEEEGRGRRSNDDGRQMSRR